MQISDATAVKRMKIGQYCQRQRCRHVELEQFLACFRVARVCQRQLGFLVYRCGTHRVKSKTFATRTRKDGAAGGVSRVSQSDVVYILISARSLTTSSCPRRRRYSVRDLINFVLCFTVRKDNCTGVYSSAVCQYFCI